MANNSIITIEKSILTPKLAKEYGRLKASDDLKFAQEKQFFMAHVKRSRDLQAAIPATLYDAFLQAASIGLSFNPQLGHAYLIPRKAKRGDPNSPVIAYASPGYRGLIHLAIMGGAIKYARADVVHERDHFVYRGPTHEPEFIAGGNGSSNAFTAKRGARVGVFCHAKTVDGDHLSDIMSAEQVEKVRKKSEASASLMWTDFAEEGWKKAVLRRASKTWPLHANAPLFHRAIETLNDNEGIILDGQADPIDVPAVELISDDQVNDLHAMLSEHEIPRADEWLRKLAGLFGADGIVNLPAEHFSDARSRLNIKINERIKGRKP